MSCGEPLIVPRISMDWLFYGEAICVTVLHGNLRYILEDDR
jgi:hypothetical protein